MRHQTFASGTIMTMLALAGALSLAACSTVEGTGRKQLLLTSESEENALGIQSYQDVLKTEKRSTDAQAQAFVERVGRRLAKVAPDHGFAYEFNLLESTTVNAFCLPGGKVAVYTAILPYCENEAGLATVMGHEIAHAVARHGGERMTQNLLVGTAEQGLAEVLTAAKVSPTTQNLSMAAFGLGSNIGVLLPFNRQHEFEADYLGLLYMAKAGYDPQEAVKFWGRFAKLTGSGTPVFLSTHPDSGDRAKTLAGNMEEALGDYHAAANQFGAGEAVPAHYRQMPK